MYDVNALMVDVRMISGQWTVSVSPNNKCSFIMETLDIDPASFYIMCGTKALDGNRVISDYDFPKRFAVEVLPIIHGGGKTKFLSVCFSVFTIHD